MVDVAPGALPVAHHHHVRPDGRVLGGVLAREPALGVEDDPLGFG
jgi:hypothetical protein